jgi:cytoskeletal protein CcmA (bactofilin family)
MRFVAGAFAAIDWPLPDRRKEYAMFNKPNLFPKAGEGPQTRPGQRAPGGAGQEPSATRQTGNPVSVTPAGANPVAEPAGRPRDDATKSDSRLIVGPEVKLKGAEILDCDTLVVEGRVSATMDSRVLRIAEDGVFEGTVGVDVAEIHGRFDGELTARDQLIIHASGRVSGKIRYGKILIEEGGQICGDIMASDATELSRRKADSPPSSVNEEKKQEEALTA